MNIAGTPEDVESLLRLKHEHDYARGSCRAMMLSPDGTAYVMLGSGQIFQIDGYDSHDITIKLLGSARS